MTITDAKARVRVDLAAPSATVDGEIVEAPDVRQLESDLGRRLYERLHVGWPSGRNSLARIDRDLGAEAMIASRLPSTPIEIDVSDIRTDGDRITGSVMGARVLLDRMPANLDSPTLTTSDSWPALSPGFYMVFGPQRPRSGGRKALWRVYLAAADLDGALDDFALAVGYLRSNATRWQAKIASTPAVYPRTDAVTVYLDHTDLHHARVLAELVGSRPSRWHRTSAFVTELAPGVGFAQEPADPDPTRRGLSYGQHRASIVARAAISGDDDLDAALAASGVDPHQYWRNSVPAPPTLLAASAAGGSGQLVR
ncbi:MAG: T3SS effector HopA1 family protein [Rhodococcus sp. (in: high G+C Gram-positive bacteria)]